MATASYELYRNSTFGECLTDSLDELIRTSQITPQLAMKVLLQFDRSMSEALTTRVKGKIVMKGHLNTYRFCDDVWTFIIDNPTFKLQDMSRLNETVVADRIKIIACNAKRTTD